MRSGNDYEIHVPGCIAVQSRPWWHTASIYQVYAPSFQDSGADGLGDVAGIGRRLDYFQWLGIDALWITPIFPSPMKDLVMRFWLERGVDGFRVDVMWHLVKDLLWRDNPVDPEYQPDQPRYYRLKPLYSTDQPEVHEIVEMMRAVLDEYGDKLLVGEVYLPVDHLVAYYGDLERSGAHLPFNFQLIVLPWQARTIGAAIDEYEGLLPAHGWPNWVLGNHDKPRIARPVVFIAPHERSSSTAIRERPLPRCFRHPRRVGSFWSIR